MPDRRIDTTHPDRKRVRTTSPQGPTMTVSIRLPADLVEKLDKLAHDAKRARAAEIWLALEKWVEQQHRG